MRDWERILISPDASLKEALEVIDREALRIALVVDEQRHLLGTLTDGDVRRALLRQMSLDVPVKQVMFAKPSAATKRWSSMHMLAWMEKKQLLQLPVVDDEGRLIGLKTLDGLLGHSVQDNPVFLMAGGFGTRLRPLTNTCPKPMLPIGQKPILEIIMQGFINAGFYRFYISTHYMPELIREHFGDGGKWGVEIQYIHEDEPLGTGGALGLLPHDEIDKPMFMMNGDLLSTLDYRSLVAFHEEHGGVATMCVREFEQQVPYGVVQSVGGRVVDMVEKPVHKFSVNAGIYLLSPELVRSVQPGTRLDMPTLLLSEIDAGRTVNQFVMSDYWLDIGHMEDFQRAQKDFESLGGF